MRSCRGHFGFVGTPQVADDVGIGSSSCEADGAGDAASDSEAEGAADGCSLAEVASVGEM
jgi:hypothetical protein